VFRIAIKTDSLACLAYSMIIGDLISALVLSAGISGLLAKRSTAIIAVTGGVVAPLCFLKSLSALSFTSILGVLGVVFSTAVMVRGCAPLPPAFFLLFSFHNYLRNKGLRYFDGTYLNAAGAKNVVGKMAESGKYFKQLPEHMRPAFGTIRGGWKLGMQVIYLKCFWWRLLLLSLSVSTGLISRH
jgi:hypothetical protein